MPKPSERFHEVAKCFCNFESLKKKKREKEHIFTKWRDRCSRLGMLKEEIKTGNRILTVPLKETSLRTVGCAYSEGEEFVNRQSR